MKAEVKSKPFSRLSAAAKRVAIAEDILKQIKASQYNIQKGMWLSVEEMDEEEILENFRKQREAGSIGSPTQNLLLGSKSKMEFEMPPAQCTCCAVGAACASAIRLFNNHELDGNEIDGIEEGKDILCKYFTEEQVELIEAAFELRCTSEIQETAEEEAVDQAVVFGNRYSDDTKRAEAIFKNIVKNKGVFVP